MGLGNFFRSLAPGNDHQLAATRYASRESATDRAARKRREKYHAKVTKTDRKGHAWADEQRRRHG